MITTAIATIGAFTIGLSTEQGTCLPQWKQAQATEQTTTGPQSTAGCWRLIPNAELVLLVYADGDIGVIPMRAFKEPT